MTDLKNNDLEAYRVVYRDSDEQVFSLEPLPIERQDGAFFIHEEVDRFTELVVGPVGEVQKGYFYPLP